MAFSFRTLAHAWSCFYLLSTCCLADTITYDWNITWVRSNPDEALERPTIGINGQWPLPQVTVTRGDRLVVNVHNQLGNQSTSIHFHGIYLQGKLSFVDQVKAHFS